MFQQTFSQGFLSHKITQSAETWVYITMEGTTLLNMIAVAA